nr:hypothetical protein [Cupriavidus sp. KK10]
MSLFDAHRDAPCLLDAGDQARIDK